MKGKQQSNSESSGKEFVEVRSRRKNLPKKTPSRHCLPSSSSSNSVSETNGGKTKKFAQEKFMGKGSKAKTVEDILLIGIKSI